MKLVGRKWHLSSSVSGNMSLSDTFIEYLRHFPLLNNKVQIHGQSPMIMLKIKATFILQTEQWVKCLWNISLTWTLKKKDYV